MPRKRGSDDPFNVGYLSKSVRLASSRVKGSVGEYRFKLEMMGQGREVRKIHKGGDFVEEYHTDMLGNRIRKRSKPIVHEVKTGESPLSDAQKTMKRRYGRRYKVVRY